MDEPTYVAPAIEDTTPVAEPLNTVTNGSEPRTITPAWRRKDHEDR